MFNIFSKDPRKKLQKEHERLLLEARDLQRAGKIPEFAAKTEEAEAVHAKLQALENKSAS